jgi:transposase
VLYQTLARLGQRITALASEAAGLEAQIAAIVEHTTPGLAAAEAGMGALSAAQMLLSWSHAGRIRSEAAFAMLSGTAPVPVPPAAPTATGSTPRRPPAQPGPARHRGQPDALPPATQAYTQRRLAEGKTERDIRRCIKRYLARHLYRALNNQLNQPLQPT